MVEGESEDRPDPPVHQRSQLLTDFLLLEKQVDPKEFLLDITLSCLHTCSSALSAALFGLLKDHVQSLDSFDLERLHLQKQLWTVYLHSETGILSKNIFVTQKSRPTYTIFHSLEVTCIISKDEVVSIL